MRLNQERKLKCRRQNRNWNLEFGIWNKTDFKIIRRAIFTFLPQTHILRKILVFLFIFVLTLSWNSQNFSFAQEEIPLAETPTSITSPSNSTTTDEITTTTEEITPVAEEIQTPPETKQNILDMLANLFGIFYDAFFGDDNLSEETITEDKIILERDFDNFRAVIILRDDKPALWLESGDAENKNWQKIADEEMISVTSPLGFQDNIIFWLSPDEKALVWFDAASQALSSQTIELSGGALVEYNFKKYEVSIWDDTIMIIPQINAEIF